MFSMVLRLHTIIFRLFFPLYLLILFFLDEVDFFLFFVGDSAIAYIRINTCRLNKCVAQWLPCSVSKKNRSIVTIKINYEPEER